MPVSKGENERLEPIFQNYMLLDTLLFRVIKDHSEEYTTLLCIPASKVCMLLSHYQSSFVAGHAGVPKCYMTISQRFYSLNLAHHIRAYMTGFYIS